jgi:outer membrane protein TolC
MSFVTLGRYSQQPVRGASIVLLRQRQLRCCHRSIFRLTLSILPLLLLLSPLPAETDEALHLGTLLEMVESANPSVLSAEAAGDAARATLRRAKSVRFPELTASLAAGAQLNPADPVEVAAGEFGTLPPALGGGMLPTEDTTVIPGGDHPLYRLEVGAKLPLFTSGEISASIRKASVGVEAAVLKRNIALRDKRSTVKSSLYLLAILKEMEKESRLQEHLAVQLSDLGRRNFENGLIVRSELLDILSREKEAGLSAYRIQRDRSNLLWRLRQAVGDHSLIVEDITLPPLHDRSKLVIYREGGETPGREELSEQLGREALEKNLELQLLRLSIGAEQEEERIASANRLLRPKVGLNLAFSYEGTRFPYLEEGWDDVGKSRWNLTALVGIELPLLDGGGRKDAADGAAARLSQKIRELSEGEGQILSSIEEQLAACDWQHRRLDYLEATLKADAAALERLEREVSLGAAGEEELISRRLEESTHRMELLGHYSELYRTLFTLEVLSAQDLVRLP